MAEETKGVVNVRPTRHFNSRNHERKWVLVDAAGKSVGRLATQIAMILRGKHKPAYTTFDDVGDFVVVVNAEKIEFRGNDKMNKKMYYKWTGWRGNLKRRTGADMMRRAPHFLIRHAVAGMLPRGSLGSRQLEKLKIYAGPEHPHKAQRPEKLEIAT
jgi:large subunit ribosomal protein L13